MGRHTPYVEILLVEIKQNLGMMFLECKSIKEPLLSFQLFPFRWRSSDDSIQMNFLEVYDLEHGLLGKLDDCLRGQQLRDLLVLNMPLL